jgi:hypothetical protein
MSGSGPTSTPARRRGPGCLGIAALIIVGVIVAFLVFAFTRPTDESKVEQCPRVVRELIEARLGEPSSFATTEHYPGNSMEGTATVRGVRYWWGCGIGITRGNRVSVDVRDPDNASVINEYVDL